MAKFTVDTHLFRELGELLVGRDSTALVELVKNAYDADARLVTVYGERLSDPKSGKIIVRDDGIGMTGEVFNAGFLRVASRLKEERDRRSARFKRRFTGAKGIGRLAAHKLARFVEVSSVPWSPTAGIGSNILNATIDWDKVESYETLDDLDGTNAISVESTPVNKSLNPGTTITLSRLRRSWTAEESARFFAEVQSFDAPEYLRQSLPDDVVSEPVLFASPILREPTDQKYGADFRVRLEGEFAAGDEYWLVVSQTASWVIEIRAQRGGKIAYAIVPTKRTLRDNPGAERFEATIDHPFPKDGPFFDARILVRVGEFSRTKNQRVWASRSSGIRVYLEGFRVLPYGEPKDDWLSIDADYTRRRRTLELLQDWRGDKDLPEVAGDDKDASLVHLPNNNYLGAVFLTQNNASSLRALVNREGFIPEAGFDTLVGLVRIGVDLCTRVRASAGYPKRQERKQRRISEMSAREDEAAKGTSKGLPIGMRTGLEEATELMHKARILVGSGKVEEAKKMTEKAQSKLAQLAGVADEFISEQALLRVVASVGTQMAAFVHEVNALLGSARTIEAALVGLMDDEAFGRLQRKRLKATVASVADLRRGLERQASYLTDVITPDARRRRSRQRLAERFDAATNLVSHQAERRRITITNEIDPDLRSPPMFAAEVTTVFANLLTNAVKAAGEDGTIRAFVRRDAESGTVIRIENSGVAVKVEQAEKWFRPFESTTTEVNPVLGQGMGLGLPITRSVLHEYGAEIRFVKPSRNYSTAIEITFPA